MEVAPSMGEHMDAVVGNQAGIWEVLCALDEPKCGLDFCSDQQSIVSSGFHLPMCCKSIFDFVLQVSTINMLQS